MPDRRERILFITGRLAEPLVRKVVSEVAAKVEIEPFVETMGISVAALMHSGWLARRLEVDAPYDRAIVPGWCQGDLSTLEQKFGIPFERGPKDILDLGEFFGLGKHAAPDLSQFDIEILAEINHAPRMSLAEIVDMARHFRESGADLIDLGCIPGERWAGIGAAVARLREEGLRVSVDSFDQEEVEAGVAAGAELVLSVNTSNIAWAADLPVEWVAIPDLPDEPEVMETIAGRLAEAGRAFRCDPIIEPVGFGFARSLGRYYEARRTHPEWALMMGIGNVTEMSEVDSAGVNFLLATLCQELRIGSVLTTEVANWSRSSVQEFDLARRLARFAIENRRLVKHLDSPLLVLRDEKPRPLGEEVLNRMSGELKDPNFRIFVERGEIHVMNRDGYWRGDDPFELFDQFAGAGELDPSHAFYLGFELCKAVTALRLSKQYSQDQALNWGYLTWNEPSAHERRREAKGTDARK